MATVKFYKIINISAAAGLIEKVEDKLIIKANDAYNKVSLAPNWGATVTWAEALTNSIDISIPEREEWIFIAEVEIDAAATVEAASSAYILNNAEFNLMSAEEAVVKLTYKDWVNDFYGDYPEVRVDGPVEVKKLYKVEKEALLNIRYKAPFFDEEEFASCLDWDEVDTEEDYNKLIEKEIEPLKKEWEELVEKSITMLIPVTYEEMLRELTK